MSLSELTLTRDLRMLIGALPGVDRQDWFLTYGRETGPLNGRGLLVAIDRRPVELRFRDFELTVDDHPRFLFHYQVTIPSTGHLTVEDINYAGSEGTSRLAVRGRNGAVIRGDDLPEDVAAIASRPVWQAAAMSRSDGPSTSKSTSRPPWQSPRCRSRPSPNRQAPPCPPRVSALRRSGCFWPSGTAQLTRLLDRTAALPAVGLVLMAMGLGAFHSLQPGHGKTLVAATVLGERGLGPRGAPGAVDDPDAHRERVAGGARALVDADRALR